MQVAVIIAAAGSSTRFRQAGDDPSRSKLDEDIGGRPVLQRTVELFIKHPDVMFIVVAGPYDEDAFRDFKARHGDKLGLLGVEICRGGKTFRCESVRNALDVVAQNAPAATHVAIHDAARPCTPPELIERVFTAASDGGHNAVIPGIQVSDTLKRVSEDEVETTSPDPLAAILGDAGKPNASVRLVEKTVDRDNLVAVQTPQLFQLDLLRRAYQSASGTTLQATDDAALVEAIGEPVVVVNGDPRNIKITLQSDIALARLFIGSGPPKQRAAHKRF